jgi:phosphatidylcholine synthase
MSGGVPTPVTRVRRCLGWAVHAYTGCGLLLAAGVTSLLLQPERTAETYEACFLLMLVAVVVDATDGTLARAVRIKEAVPGFDGRRLDDLVDFLLYACLPLLLIDRAALLPEGCRGVLLVALVASAYGFCQADIKTADGAFLGFPSYWNVVAFYLFELPVTGGWAVGLILGLSVLTFVPSRYPYPTMPGRLNRLMLLLSVPWALLLAAALVFDWDERVRQLMIRASMAYPVVYLGTAWVTSLRRRVSGFFNCQPGGPHGEAHSR